ncbi:hypothetical protein E2320_007307 [Naja naja]|nr:hypothetical protein E2320_007307 [Naja naja]
MSWNLKDDLREYLVAAAPYGGPIALMKKKKEKSPSSRPVLEIYSASGIQLASVVWKDSPAMFLGWTTSEELLSVQENGIVLLHSLFGEFKKKVTMINTDRQGLQGPPSCWTVLCQNRVTNILLAVGQELYLLDDAAYNLVVEASEEIFKIASMSPGALLLEAQKEYEAASFGKCFIDKFAPENFVETCRDLRVLNAVRDYQIGMPLSFDQYKQLTKEVLLDRVVLRRLYPIAIKICEYLRLSEFQGISRILAHWACYKVQQRDKSDEELAQVINQKLGDAVGISYSDIATQAYESNRQELAIKIEIVYTVISRLKDELGRGDFFMALQNQPVALSLYRQIKLLRQQRRFQDEFDKPYVDLSLHDTVYNLILDGKHKFAEHLYRDFRIPDKRALAEQGAWEDLEKFSKSKRSPIGYLPFAEISMKYGSPGEAKKYAARVTPEQKVKAFLLVGDFSQAAEAAVERKNEAEMALILSKCTDASVVAKLEQAKAQLGKK